MLARPVTAERLKMVARRKAQILENMRRIQRREHRTSSFDQISGEPLAEPARHGLLGELSAGADDHDPACITV